MPPPPNGQRLHPSTPPSTHSHPDSGERPSNPNGSQRSSQPDSAQQVTHPQSSSDPSPSHPSPIKSSPFIPPTQAQIAQKPRATGSFEHENENESETPSRNRFRKDSNTSQPPMIRLGFGEAEESAKKATPKEGVGFSWG